MQRSHNFPRQKFRLLDDTPYCASRRNSSGCRSKTPSPIFTASSSSIRRAPAVSPVAVFFSKYTRTCSCSATGSFSISSIISAVLMTPATVPAFAPREAPPRAAPRRIGSPLPPPSATVPRPPSASCPRRFSPLARPPRACSSPSSPPRSPPRRAPRPFPRHPRRPTPRRNRRARESPRPRRHRPQPPRQRRRRLRGPRRASRPPPQSPRRPSGHELHPPLRPRVTALIRPAFGIER